MSKAKRSLLFSLFTLIMAVAITATSTYAWFVVNREVTATNMQVTVKSDTKYLVISSTSTLGTDTEYAFTAGNAQVLPVTYDEDEASGIKWKTAIGQGYSNGAATEDNSGNAIYTSISSEDVTAGKYFVTYEFYIGLASSSTVDAANLKVQEMTVTNVSGQNTMKGAVSAVVQCSHGATPTVDGTLDFAQIDSISDTLTVGTLASSIARSTAYKITVWVYVDGDHTSVTSANAANLGTFALSIKFQVDA